MFRAVITPEKGATICLNDCKTFIRCKFDWAAFLLATKALILAL